MQVAAALHDYGLQKLSLLSRSLTKAGNLPQLGGTSEMGRSWKIKMDTKIDSIISTFYTAYNIHMLYSIRNIFQLAAPRNV